MSREENAGDCGDCSHCRMCGCDRDDHFEPDPYDMGNAELDAAGHLNHCGDCRECFGPEFASGQDTTEREERRAMSECEVRCLGVGEGHDHITITRPRFVHYIARVRERGRRRYTIIGRSRSRRKAYRMLADAMQDRRWFRGDVLGDEELSYYGPVMLVEMRR